MKKLAITLLLPLMLFADTNKVCKGTTVKGEPCKSTIVMSDGYCRAHSPATPRCGATTSKGTPCKMAVKNEGDKCRHHINK